jgi:Secretion system C-terminal sorting domain
MIPKSRFQIRNWPFFQLFTSRSQLKTSSSSRSWLSIPRFLIPDSRLGLLRAIPILLATLLLTLTVPLHASTPGFDTLVNYDTAWTYVYDGGKYSDGTNTYDDFFDVKALPDGGYACVGASGDTTTTIGQLVLLKLNAVGKLVWKKLYKYKYNQYARSIVVAKNGDFIIGGMRYSEPFIFRTDSIGNIKWSTWVYDSVNNRQSLLTRAMATVNCVRETSRGTIICAAGDYFTDASYMYGSTNDNYAVYLEFDAEGKILKGNQWNNLAGYNVGAFDIEETQGGDYLLSGNQTVLDLDTSGHIKWNNAYTFSLNGVGSEVNNISRCKIIKGNIPVVAGQAYEGNCWTNFKKLFYDAWWSPVDYADGGNTTWDTAGYQGGDDQLNDFTQLSNGNLVFVGKRNSSNAQTSGIWVYVTPVTGSHILWENVIAGSLYAGEPLSVCATPDSGFTVVGKIGGNAFASHFIPKAPSAIVSRRNFQAKSINSINVHVSGAKIVVSGNFSTGEVSLFDITGRRIATQTGNKEIAFDISKLARGTYFVRFKRGSDTHSMNVFYER